MRAAGNIGGEGLTLWTLEKLPAELQAFFNDSLPAIVRREVREALAETRKNEPQGGNSLLRRKEFCEFYGISSSTLDRRVYDGTVEKDLSFGPGCPRYRLKQGKSLSEDNGRKAR